MGGDFLVGAPETRFWCGALGPVVTAGLDVIRAFLVGGVFPFANCQGGLEVSFASLSQRVVNAAVVFVHQRQVSQHARQTQQNREAIYRDAHRVKNQLEESESQQRNLQAQIEQLQAKIDQFRQREAYNPFVDPDKVAKYAAQAQAEGVSLPVAQRLLKILQQTRHHR